MLINVTYQIPADKLEAVESVLKTLSKALNFELKKEQIAESDAEFQAFKDKYMSFRGKMTGGADAEADYDDHRDKKYAN